MKIKVLNHTISKNWSCVENLSLINLQNKRTILKIYIFMFVIISDVKMLIWFFCYYFCMKPYLFSCADAISDASSLGECIFQQFKYIIDIFTNPPFILHNFNLFARHRHQKRWLKTFNSLPVNNLNLFYFFTCTVGISKSLFSDFLVFLFQSQITFPVSEDLIYFLLSFLF